MRKGSSQARGEGSCKSAAAEGGVMLCVWKKAALRQDIACLAVFPHSENLRN